MEVFVTPRAEQDFDSIVQYIQSKWGEQVTRQFTQKIDDTLFLLKNFPQIGSVESGLIRGFQISPQTRILYRIRGEKVIILSFFDVRQHPGKKSV